MLNAVDQTPDREREFQFGEKAFREITQLIYDRAGIVMDTSKRELVYSRLSRRLRALGIQNFNAYVAFIKSPKGQSEQWQLINALTTNHTRFFREPHHFEFLKKTIAPYWVQRFRRGDKTPVRIWSAGCSTGEEVYSVAMVLDDALKTAPDLDWKILATDIDTRVLATAKAGQYHPSAKQDIPALYHVQHLTKTSTGDVQISNDLRKKVQFNQLNLHGEWPMRRKFDLIFCRNVVIYFSQEDKEVLVSRFCDALNADGHFIMGHSESINTRSAPLKLVGRTIYRPSASPEGGAAHG